MIIIKTKRRTNELFKIFIKHTSLLPRIMILKQIILFSNQKKIVIVNIINILLDISDIDVFTYIKFVKFSS